MKLNPITLQQQLYNELDKAIKSGKYKPGNKIPTEYELSEMYQVSRVTVRAAIQQLVNEEKLIRRVGKGTFVKPVVYRESSTRTGGSFTENCLNRNVKPSTEIIERKLTKGKQNILELLEASTKEIITIKRIRLVNNEPCIVEIDYFPSTYNFLLVDDLKDKSLLRLIQKKTGLVLGHTEDSFSIEYASKEFASYLNCPVRSPLLVVDQIVTTAKDKAIYLNKQYILASKYIYVNRT